MALPDTVASELPASLAALQQQTHTQPLPTGNKRSKLPPNPSSTKLIYERALASASTSGAPSAALRGAELISAYRASGSSEYAPGGRSSSEICTHSKRAQPKHSGREGGIGLSRGSKATTAPAAAPDIPDIPQLPEGVVSEDGGDSVSEELRWQLPVAPARGPATKRDVMVLSKWLEVETARFNAAHAKRDLDQPLVDFLWDAASRARTLYSRAVQDLTRQVSAQCEERGMLLAEVWQGHAAIMHTVHLKLREEYKRACARTQSAEAEAQSAEIALRDERVQAHVIAAKQQEEIDKLRSAADVTRVFQGMGGGEHGSGMAVTHRSSHTPRASGTTPRTLMMQRNRLSAAVPAGSLIPSAAAERDDIDSNHVSSTAGVSDIEHRPSKGGGLGEALISTTRCAYVKAAALLAQLQATSEEAEAENDSDVAVAGLRSALEDSQGQLINVLQQILEMEKSADHVIMLELRVKLAESERDALLEAARSLTPRPPRQLEPLECALGAEGLALLQTTVEKHKQWGSDELAAMLLGGGVQEAALAEGLQLGVLACLQPAAALGRLDFASVSLALQVGESDVIAVQCSPPQYQWLQNQARRPHTEPARLAELLLGSTAEGRELDAATFGCMATRCQGLGCGALAGLIDEVRRPTSERVSALEAAAAIMRCELLELGDLKLQKEAEEKVCRREVAK